MQKDALPDAITPFRPWAAQDTRLSGLAWFTVFALSAIGLVIITNQIFNLKLGGFRPISTAYYYIVVGLFLPVAFLSSPAREADETRVRWYDWGLAALAFNVCMFFASNSESILYKGWEFVAPTYVIVQAGLLVALALEAVRRCAGVPLFVICAIFATFPLYTGHLPGFLWGVQLSFSDTVLSHSLGVESIIGIPIRVIADLLIGFIVFGVALTASGGGVFFMDLASALLGHARGGPAKVAILSSGFFGSLSGSVISNVISTGSMTIPTMKKCGYPASYAGAVESCASTGGALMLLATALIRAEKGRRIEPLVEMIMETGRTTGMLVGVLAGVGLVVGALSITGVGNAFSRELLQYAGGNPYLLLIFGACSGAGRLFDDGEPPVHPVLGDAVLHHAARGHGRRGCIVHRQGSGHEDRRHRDAAGRDPVPAAVPFRAEPGADPARRHAARDHGRHHGDPVDPHAVGGLRALHLLSRAACRRVGSGGPLGGRAVPFGAGMAL
ncbi:Tripartite ATP-independent transporter, DctM component [Tropicibacter naphthalenivorans]|uniref:TRAP transporter, 4TM/12TM fusion protein n=1 Tax=Tropicibacter naphthalenivorans TaxID=441103 RepID=A0A0P1GGN9_9RHOB|nr:TRAP transporter, 4TM/12TM fusion protein [Tropicibacter naphthalenivorans]SMC91591.1 Tripartite ATP-independent transporter, DctM component [Tropicibacter naphthalenivorans]